MHTHIQGAFLLILLLLAFWAVLDWSSDVIGDALGGEDRAVVAKPRVEGVAYGPLNNVEVAALQQALTDVGYDPGPTDGFLGILTRTAINEAKTDLNLVGISDRMLLETLTNDLSRQSDTEGLSTTR